MIEKRLILAGRCVFTITGKEGRHYTYRVNKKKDKAMWFVDLLIGPDNEANYTYLGMLNHTTGKVFPTTSKLKKDSLPFRAINFVLSLIWAGKPEEIEKKEGKSSRKPLAPSADARLRHRN